MFKIMHVIRTKKSIYMKQSVAYLLAVFDLFSAR
jgi:hypothetical protein